MGGGFGGGFRGAAISGGGFGGGVRGAAISGSGFGSSVRAATIGGGGFRSAPIGGIRTAAIGAVGPATVGRGPSFVGGRFPGGFHHGFHHRFHRRVFFVGAGFGPYAYYDDYYPYDYGYETYYGDNGCYLVRQRVLTRYGWRIRPVQVCG
jgi:hypothetical protein